MKKKPVAPTQEPKEKIKAGIFDDGDEIDFSISRSSTQKRKAKEISGTTVDHTDFALSKPTFAARKQKVHAGTLVNADSFNVQRKRVGTIHQNKKLIFEDSDEDKTSQ